MSAEPGRGSWSGLRAQLEDAGFRPSRRLGQNFLLDENLLRAVVRDAGVAPGDRVLEVGTGLGFLTRHLLRAGAELIGVEVDARLLEFAARELASERPWRALRADVLAGKHALDPQLLALLWADAPWQVVANLPYSVSAPLLAVLADLDHPPARLTVLVQREVAERILAAPGSADWGVLSVRLQLDYTARRLRAVPAVAFWPRPQVESTLVRLDRRADAATPQERARLMTVAAVLFQHRRQSLARVLREHLGAGEQAVELLGALGLDPRQRAEDLDLARLRALACRLTASA